MGGMLQTSTVGSESAYHTYKTATVDPDAISVVLIAINAAVLVAALWLTVLNRPKDVLKRTVRSVRSSFIPADRPGSGTEHEDRMASDSDEDDGYLNLEGGHTDSGRNSPTITSTNMPPVQSRSLDRTGNYIFTAAVNENEHGEHAVAETEFGAGATLDARVTAKKVLAMNQDSYQDSYQDSPQDRTNTIAESIPSDNEELDV